MVFNWPCTDLSSTPTLKGLKKSCYKTILSGPNRTCGVFYREFVSYHNAHYLHSWNLPVLHRSLSLALLHLLLVRERNDVSLSIDSKLLIRSYKLGNPFKNTCYVLSMHAYLTYQILYSSTSPYVRYPTSTTVHSNDANLMVVIMIHPHTTQYFPLSTPLNQTSQEITNPTIYYSHISISMLNYGVLISSWSLQL
jgi:hypothetical protein